MTDDAAPDFLQGSVEPHAGMLNSPAPDQLLYKVMCTEHLLTSLEGAYMHFNRVDSYRDFTGADSRDAEQLPRDRSGNEATVFENAPEFSAADYYDQSRRRTYANCFSLRDSEYIWREYGNGGAGEKVCLVFNFGKLREMLNTPIAADQAAILYDDIRCKQIFSINYGIVDYVDWETYRANIQRLPNPITYTYLKDKSFESETELRVSLSALGLGHFVLADGSRIEFPPSLRFDFDYRAAIANGAIEQIMLSPDCDKAKLASHLAQLGMSNIDFSDPAIFPQTVDT